MTNATVERQNHRPLHRSGDLPRPTVSQAVRRHWFVAALPLLVLVGLALAVSSQRPETHTAQTQPHAGPVGASPQTFYGVTEASQALAGTYARVVDAQAVIEPIGAKLRLNPGEVASRIEASPIPESSLILIEAEGPSERQAIELANLTGDSLIRYAASLNRRNDDSSRLLAEFRRTSRSLQERASARDRVKRRTGGQPTRTAEAQLGEIEGDVEALRLKLKTLSSLYQTSQQGKASASLVQVLSPAARAESDRLPVLQGLVFLALVGGAASGVALAVVRSRRVARRDDTDIASLVDIEPAGVPVRKGRWRRLSPEGRKAPSRALLALFVLALVGGGLTAAYIALGKPELPGIESAAHPPTQAYPAPHDPPAVATPSAKPRHREAKLQLIPTRPVRVCLVDASNKRLLAGEVLRPGTPVRAFRSKRLRVSLGAPDVTMRVNDRHVAVPELPGPIGYEMTARGQKRLTPGQQPICRQSSPSTPG